MTLLILFTWTDVSNHDIVYIFHKNWYFWSSYPTLSILSSSSDISPLRLPSFCLRHVPRILSGGTKLFLSKTVTFIAFCFLRYIYFLYHWLTVLRFFCRGEISYLLREIWSFVITVQQWLYLIYFVSRVNKNNL